VLTSHGLLLDLRPDRDPGGRRAKLLDTYVVAGGADIEAGAMVETPAYYGDYVASDRAVEHVIRQGLFTLHAAEIFRPRWYFRMLDILEETLAKDWTGTTLPAPVRQHLRVSLDAQPKAQIAVAESFPLNVLRKR
jgi:hypothetical protein